MQYNAEDEAAEISESVIENEEIKLIESLYVQTNKYLTNCTVYKPFHYLDTEANSKIFPYCKIIFDVNNYQMCYYDVNKSGKITPCQLARDFPIGSGYYNIDYINRNIFNKSAYF